MLRRWNNVNHTTTSEYDAGTGQVTRSIDANGQVSVHSYDALGRLNAELTADGIESTTTQSWCCALPLALSRAGLECPRGAVFVVHKEATDGRLLVTYHDVLGRTIRTATRAFDGRMAATDQQYDAVGRLSRSSLAFFLNSTSSASLWKQFQYDAVDRPVRIQSPDGGVVLHSYDGLRVTTSHPLNASLTTTSTMTGLLLTLHDSRGGRVEFSYNSRGQRTRTYYPLTNHSTVEEWDDYGRRVSLLDPHMGEVRYAYSVHGQVLGQTYAAVGASVSLEYDLLDRLVRRVYAAPYEETRWTFDTEPLALGKLTRVQRSDGYAKHWTYGDRGRAIAQTVHDSGETHTTNFTYNARSQLMAITLPSSLVLSHEYSEWDGTLVAVLDGSVNATAQPALWRVRAKEAAGPRDGGGAGAVPGQLSFLQSSVRPPGAARRAGQRLERAAA